MTDFFRGLQAPFRGAIFVARNRLWGYVAAPVLVNVLLALCTTWLALRTLRPRLPALSLGGWPLLASLLVMLLSAVASAVFFVLFQPLIGGPFVDALTEKVESLVCGTVPRVSVFATAWQAAGHGLLKSILYAAALLVTFGLSFVTGLGGVLGLGLYGLFLAFDAFDYPQARRRVTFGGKWRYLVLHPSQTLGYCLGASIMYLIPIAIVVAPAFAAVGATLAFLHTTPGASPLGASAPATQPQKGLPR